MIEFEIILIIVVTDLLAVSMIEVHPFVTATVKLFDIRGLCVKLHLLAYTS
jgi:hypothetical protein